jgi:hypothetical protein
MYVQIDIQYGFCFLQLCSLESAYDSFHHDNPGVGYFLIHEEEGEGQGGGAISLHPLKEFNTIHSRKGKVLYRSVHGDIM